MRHMSDEAKKKLSLAMIGKQKGVKRTESTKAKMKESQTLRWLKEMEETSYKEIDDEGFILAKDDLYVNKYGDVIRVKDYNNKVYYKLLMPSTTKAGYKQVSDTTKQGAIHIHTLMLLAWIGPKPEGMEVLHLDGNPANNRLENLKYGTHSENMATARKAEHHAYHGKYIFDKQYYLTPDGNRIEMDPMNYYLWLKAVGRKVTARKFLMKHKDYFDSYFDNL